MIYPPIVFSPLMLKCPKTSWSSLTYLLCPNQRNPRYFALNATKCILLVTVGLSLPAQFVVFLAIPLTDVSNVVRTQNVPPSPSILKIVVHILASLPMRPFAINYAQLRLTLNGWKNDASSMVSLTCL